MLWLYWTKLMGIQPILMKNDMLYDKCNSMIKYTFQEMNE